MENAMTKAPGIMIVEDDDFVAQAVKLELEYLGYAVPVIAGSGEEAVAQAQRHRPDLVLMDIVLPGKMDGIAAAHQISGFSIPVVYLSGHMDEPLLERAKITEPFGYLLKPYSPQQLHATIAMALYKWRMENRLRESAWMSAAFLCVSDAIFILDAGERIVLMNPAAQQLIKIDQADAVGRSWRDVLETTGELSSETLGALIAQALHRGEEVWRETGASLVLDGGTAVPVSLGINPLWREETIHGVSLVVRDISRKLALAHERRQLASLVENSDDFIGVSATDGGALYLNPAGRRLVGAGSLEAVKGRNILDFFSPAGQSVVQGQMFPALLHQGKWRGELNCRHLGNGGDIPVELNTFLIKEAKTGQGLTFGSIARDITQRKQDERTLAESNARFSAIFNSITDAVIFVDTQRRILLTNPAFTTLFGYEDGELADRTTKCLYVNNADYHEQGQVRFNAAVRPGKSLYEMRYRRKDGSSFIGETVGLPARGADDNVVGFVAVIRDITARVEMARSLQQERAFLKAVLENIEDGVVACDAAGILTLFNRALARLHGLPVTPIPPEQWAEHYDIYQED
ncbi:MAG TPA: hypothetical protein DEP05_09975, partial [Betaproteobacteria bacterium]|nr:hypothetical protein [Betaproteobacteria bacterium]